MFTLFEETGFPREFEILIRPSLSRADTYMVLAHEMSHVEQYARGRLHFYQRDSDRARWKNKVYKSTIKSLKEYLRKPWEIEATKMEEKLIEALYLHLKENNQ
jgi:hypothetical protein